MHKIVTTSLLEEEGVDELEEAIATLFFEGSIEAGDLTYVSNARHIALLIKRAMQLRMRLKRLNMVIPLI